MGHSNSDLTTLYVESSKSNDIRPELAAKIVAQKWPLYELKAEDVSLEDVFLQLTTQEEEETS